VGKGGRYVRLTTLPPFGAVVMKSGNLNLLEPSGFLQGCTGTAFLYCGKMWLRSELIFYHELTNYFTLTSEDMKWNTLKWPCSLLAHFYQSFRNPKLIHDYYNSF